MEHPICRVCGHKHGTREPHVFDAPVVEEVKPAPPISVEEVPLKARRGDRAKYNQRQREYMRKRRAK
jgi:hypothetical protein